VLTPFTVMLVLLVLLLVVGFATEDDGAGSAPAPRAAPVPVIADRVEELRGLQFDEVPRPQAVNPAQARREGLRELDREYPAERREADEAVLKLLGLIDPDVDLRDVAGTIFGQGVAGYYSPKDGRLRTVSGAATGTVVLTEIVLAHELTHALEDQRFELDLSGSATDDASLARLSLIEGSATALMYDYVGRYFTAEEALGGLLAGAFADTGSLPAFLQTQLTFPYLGGQQFVQNLRDRAGGSWKLIDLAYEARAPSSTEQILHPDRYLRVDEPQRVRLRVRLGPGWERRLAGTWGELQTRELLASAGGGGSGDAAAGWGGDRYELWSRPGEGEVLVMRWRWDTPRDEAEFARKLRTYVDSLDGTAVMTRRAGAVTLVIAPDAATARRLGQDS
jgi:hypothetical protein